MIDKFFSQKMPERYSKNYMIRLYYVAFGGYRPYATTDYKIGQTMHVSDPFIIPNNMSMEDACKVVSYLSEKVEKEYNLEPASKQSVTYVDAILSNYGFKKIETDEEKIWHATGFAPYGVYKEREGVVDLFTVGGDFDIFKESDLSERYFNWFTEGVTLQEINNIYNRIKPNINEKGI